MFRLPRNMAFINRLPTKFTLRVLKEQNNIPEGRWYFVEINKHRLNLFSESVLKEGSLLQVEKQNNLLLKIVRKI